MLRRLFTRHEDFSDVEVTFISKDDCHLCEEALAVVEQVRRKHPFRLKLVKIRKGDEWYDRYWDKIPVVLIDGRMGFKYRVEAKELIAKLRRNPG
jgi:hypothetical protein